MINIYALPPFVVFVAFFFLGLFFLLNLPRSRPRLLFAALCFETSWWQFAWFISFFVKNPGYIDLCAKLAYVTIVFVPFTFYHFVVSFLQVRRESKFLVVGYIYIFIFMICLFPTDIFIRGHLSYSWGHFAAPGQLYFIVVIAALAAMLRGIYLLSQALKNHKNTLATKNQIKYLLLGLGIYSLVAVDFLQVYGFSWYPLESLFFILSFAVIAYAISKHQVMDIRIVIRKAAVYGTIALLISFIYLSIVYGAHAIIFSNDLDSNQFIINLSCILVIALLFKPLEIVVNNFFERRIFHGTLPEISAQKEQLETEVERGERLKSVGILAAGMAHEIKNPLTALNTFADYLPEKFNDPEFRIKFSRIVKQEVIKVKEIVGNLLLFSKPKEPKMQKCNIDDLICDITELLSSEMIKANVQLRFKKADHYVIVDPDQIKQAVINIVMNAIDAMKPKGGVLDISIKEIGKDIEIKIKDTGCGIAKDKQKHIFDPFYSNKESGTGLGLAVTHSIVTKNGGRISVNSNGRQGTTFSITFRQVR